MNFLAHIFVCGSLFLAVDALWIGVIANNFYHDELGRMLADKPRFFPAFIFYVVYLWALLYFALEPALAIHSWPYLLKHAAFFGAAAYTTYDMTNAATLRRWPFRLAVVDIIWGTLLSVGVVAAGYLIFP